MENKKFWVILALALVLGLALTGCNNGTTPSTTSTTTWSAVTSIDQANGTWTGLFSESYNIQEFFGEDWDVELGVFYGNITVTESMTMTFIINAEAKTYSVSYIAVVGFSGGNIETPGVWDEIENDFEGSGAMLDETKKTASWTRSMEPVVMDEDEIEVFLNAGIQISGDGRQLKIPVDLIDYLAGTSGAPETTFTKQ